MRRIKAIIVTVMAGILYLSLNMAVLADGHQKATAKLFEAVWNNDMVTVRQVMGEGADPWANDENGLSAIDIAVDKGYFDIAHYLLAVQKQRRDSEIALRAEAPERVIAPISSEVPIPAPRIRVEEVPLDRQPAPVTPETPETSTPPLILDVVPQSEPEPILIQAPANPANLPTKITRIDQKTAQKSEKIEPEISKAPEVAAEKSGILETLGNLFSSQKPVAVPVPEPIASEPDVEQTQPSPPVIRELVKEEPTPIPFTPQEVASVQTSPVITESPQPIPPPAPPETITEPSPGLVDQIKGWFTSDEPQASAEFGPVQEQALPELEKKPVPLKALPMALNADKIEPEAIAAIAATPEQPVEDSNAPSLFDRIGGFFSTDKPIAQVPQPAPATEIKAIVAEPAPVSQPQIRTLRRPKPLEPEAVEGENAGRFNPFTKLTDMILDLIPGGEDEAENAFFESHEGGAAPVGGADRAQEKSVYQVADLTEQNDPYKVEVVAQPALPEYSDAQVSIQTEVANVAAQTDGPVGAPPEQIGPARRVLDEDELSFGGRGRIGSQLLNQNPDLRDCVVKKPWDSHFCVESFTWAGEIQEAFGSPMFFNGGGRSIVHYRAGKSAQYHGQFPTQSFERIGAYLISEFGAPTERPEIWTALLAEPKRRNRTYRWIASVTDKGAPVIIELREMDDLRWSVPPDKRNGVIRMYRKGDQSIFQLLTTADLLLMQVRKGAQPIGANR